MKKFFLSTIVTALLIIVGCTKENSKNQTFQLEGFYNGFVQSNIETAFSKDFKPYYSIVEYSNGKVSKVIHRNSVGVPMGPGGFDDFKILNSYHKYSYKENMVELIWEIDSDEIIYTPVKIQLTLDNNGRIIKRLDCNTKDTTYYYYSEMGNLERSFTRTRYNMTITRDFFFDLNNNLVHISGLMVTNRGFKYHIFEYFRKFDTGLNGFKNFGIIEGAFIRSLSKNNYNEYARAIYDDNNLRTDLLWYRLPVTYDGKGYPIYIDRFML